MITNIEDDLCIYFLSSVWSFYDNKYWRWFMHVLFIRCILY